MNEETNVEANKTNNKAAEEAAGYKELFETATKDVKNLGPIGRIFVAGLVIIALFKLTPILDLMYYAFQIVVLPMLFMVAWGVISKETYDLSLGWVDDLINHLREKKATKKEN
jgi:hypothetical protein